jgi:phage terminase large subunit-like protein
MILTVPNDGKAFYPTLGAAVCQFIEENLVFGPGDLRGEPARLDEEKRALIWRMYEVFPRKHVLAGRRRFKRVGISLAKGTAKTELAAWIAACELHAAAPVRCIGWKGNIPIGGPVTDPFVVLCAYTEDQSDELCYGALKAILEESPIRKDFDIGLSRIMRAKGDGKAVSIAGAPNARDGARTTFQVCDETHWWTLERLKQAHQTMLANIPKRKMADAWTLETTTAPEPGGGSVAEQTMEYAEQIENGTVKDERLFFFHRQASDKHDLQTEEGARAAILEASGSAAEWRDIDSIVQLWRDPTTDRPYWERVYCNRKVRQTRKAFDVQQWKSLRAPNPVQAGDAITLGFDGSLKGDATGIVATHLSTGFQWVPGLWECPYGPQGKDWQVPAGAVNDTVRALFAEYKVIRCYADPPYWQSWIATWQGDFGDKVVIEWWTNRRRPMSYALESFDTAIKTGRISHDGNGDLARHIGNAHKRYFNEKDEEGKALWYIEKERSDSPHKIDLAMCAVLSNEARNDAIASGAIVKESVYESRGLLIID